jgi:hypothetical protein
LQQRVYEPQETGNSKNNNIKFRPSSKGGEEAEEEASGTESEGSSSDKRMKHSSHHADGDELSEDVENMGIEVHDAYPEE